MAKRKFRPRKPERKKPMRSTKLYPIIWCTSEELAIAVSRKIVHTKRDTVGKVKIRNKDQVNHSQWRDWNSEFREGYEIDFSQLKAGEKVYCPKCGEPVDFRVFPASKPPKLTKVKYDADNNRTKTEELSDLGRPED